MTHPIHSADAERELVALKDAIDWLTRCAEQNASWDASNRIVSKESRDEYDAVKARTVVENLVSAAVAKKAAYDPADLNNYSLILSELGMEEEGDPVAEVKRLCAAAQVGANGAADIRTWQDRRDDDIVLHGEAQADSYVYMNAEIADLRARLAAGAPVEMSQFSALDLAELEHVAKKADEITTDLYGDRYMQGSWSRVDLDKEQDDFITAVKPATVLALIAAIKSRAAGAPAETSKPLELAAKLISELAHALKDEHWQHINSRTEHSRRPIKPTQIAQLLRQAKNFCCSCPSGDGSLRWPCVIHGGIATPAATIGAGEGKDAARLEQMESALRGAKELFNACSMTKGPIIEAIDAAMRSKTSPGEAG